MLNRLLFAIGAFIVVFVVCLILGAVLETTKVDVLATVGKLLSTWAALLGIAAGLIAFATGRTF